MAIITISNNPKSDAKYARHRSIWKGLTNQLLSQENICRDLGIIPLTQTIIKYYDHPATVRQKWQRDIGDLPTVKVDVGNVGKYVGTTGGLRSTLGATGEFLEDLKLIWLDFLMIYTNRSSVDAPAARQEELFVSHYHPEPNKVIFDLLYSKWGNEQGRHRFYHWRSEVWPRGVNPNRAAIVEDEGDDED
jgi:hypothetical protein